MSENNKILLTLPSDLICEIEKFAGILETNPNEFIREGLAFYIKHLKSKQTREALEKGYRDVGQINLKIANECLQADNLQFENYLEMLSECEK